MKITENQRKKVGQLGLRQQSDDRMRRGDMRSESRGASNHRCSRDALVEGQSAGPFVSPAAKNSLGRIAAAEDPSAERGGEDSVARSRHDNLPSSPRKAPERAFSKDTGVSTIWVGVLVPGAWYPHHPPVLVVIELELHHNSKAMEPETEGDNTSTSRRCILPKGYSLNDWSCTHSFWQGKIQFICNCQTYNNK